MKKYTRHPTIGNGLAQLIKMEIQLGKYGLIKQTIIYFPMYLEDAEVTYSRCGRNVRYLFIWEIKTDIPKVCLDVLFASSVS